MSPICDCAIDKVNISSIPYRENLVKSVYAGFNKLLSQNIV